MPQPSPADISTAFDNLIGRTVALDLETTKDGGTVKSIGAVYQGRTFVWEGGGDRDKALAALDSFARGARFVLGHNLFGHDLPFLRSAAPGLGLLRLPVIDTLYLSPLAFPQNPYHRLVKDYKLVRSSLSDPLEDARLALSIFADQWESLRQQGAARPELLSFYAFCFQDALFNGFGGQGLAAVLRMLGARQVMDANQAGELFGRLTRELVCGQAVVSPAAGSTRGAAAAYSLAWLQVAGGNSVLPPWVRHQFVEVVPVLKRLRDIPCNDPACGYCRATHDPQKQLKRFFGFDDFRVEPRTPNGESLQAAVVLAGMQDKPLMAILPTGGGKSLCYQLPALVRHLRRGLLTVVISPLQALMKDQIDNLARNTGSVFAAGIYGLLTPPERGEVLERVRMGDIGILYIAPEQLRSRSVRQVLLQREIGCWVFDEAHCLSKWGHDFRPDYLYAGRFIRELCVEQGLALPSVACFTATAKPDVTAEILAYFQTELGQTLQLFAGGVERGNLHFDVLPVGPTEKLEQTHAVVQRHLGGGEAAAAIVYTATRRTAEEVRDFLLHKGVTAEAFHAGLEAHAKRRVIDAFVAGEIPVICATNAFGMGIDKSNIRLVLHYDLLGSLENYLQEAGRAGRDLQPAACILLYDPHDAEKQFQMGARSEIQKHEIQRILKCLRRCKRNRDNEIVITTQELLREEDLAELFEKGDASNDTRLRTAIAWLERSDFVQRNQNLTQVFQGRPLVKSLDAAEAIIAKAGLSKTIVYLWRGILRVLFNTPAEQSRSADDIAESLFDSKERLAELEQQCGLTPAQLVINAMHEMAELGLLDQGVTLSAFVRPRGKNSAEKLLAKVSVLETGMLKLWRQEAPDAAEEEWSELDIRRLNQRLNNDGLASDPVTLRNLVKSLTQDGRGLAGAHGSIELQHLGRLRYRVRLRRSWRAIEETAALRRTVAELIVRVLVEKAGKAATASPDEGAGELLISFSTNELVQAIRQDLLLHASVQKPLAAIDRGLMFLHEHKIITLQNGLAVFRQAMTLRLQPQARRRYTLGDFKPLAMHYLERRFQIHVIVEYADLALNEVARALRLTLDYFSLPRAEFTKKYFAGRREVLERATSMASYRQIVESLNNPVQIGLVGRPVQDNLLVLAGPGAGKTRIVVHRCAYLLRVERVPARSILVLCFNHAAAMALRKRLAALVGADARGVTVATYHGAAMRLAGISLRDLMEANGDALPDFNGLIREATALLKGEKEIPGRDPDEIRDQLLEGFSHILVDEYQDIDQDQYELVSAVAGRKLAEEEGRLAIMAVGDDDQNIYAFRGANIAFIQRFQADYHCETDYLVENYRSSAHIIAASNQLIGCNRDRMKAQHPIRVNHQRAAHPGGGIWERLDPLVRGRVQRLLIKDADQQGAAVFAEMQRLRSLRTDIGWDSFAVLGRTRQVLDGVRAVLEDQGVPLRLGLAANLPLHRIREVHRFLARMKPLEKEIRRASALSACLPVPRDGKSYNPWVAMLAEMQAAYEAETDDAELPVAYFIDWLYEAMAAQRREKALGRGVLLSTVHGAKGLEFDHVIILDGQWPWPPDPRKREEERRLLYVGMSRAKQTLCLMEMELQGNPYSADLEGEWVVQRQAPQSGLMPRETAAARYHMLGPADLYLSHAGRFAKEHEIHRELDRLDAGDLLRLSADGSGAALYSASGVCVGRLSGEGSARYTGRLAAVTQARVLGLMQWLADDSGTAFRRALRVESWEVPLVELVVATGQAAGRREP